MKKVIFLYFALTLLCCVSSFAIQEFESVVVDQKFNSSSTIVIDQKEIQKSRAKDLTSLLASQANISITQSNFQPNSIYLRGGDSSHVLILVDGVPFYDATTVQRTINLNSLNLKSVRRIEVIKGSQSVLFGGQALSGVIKIETIPTEIKSQGFVQTQAGTGQSLATAVGFVQPIGENQELIFRASTSRKDNRSPVEDSTKLYPARLATGEAAYVLRNETIETLVKAQTSFDKTFIASTNFPSYQSMDADNFETSTYQHSGLVSVKGIGFYGKPSLSLAQQRSVRLYEQDAISGGGVSTKQDYVGDLRLVRFEISPLDLEKWKLRLGLSETEEQLVYRNKDILKSDDKVDFQGVFGKLDYLPATWLRLEAGARADYKKYKSAIGTYQLGATINDAIKLEQSTGFKQPSLFQLYSGYGNINLESEKSTSFSLSYEHNFTADWFVSATYFENRFSNLIVALGSPLHYENIGSSKSTGVEATTGFRFPDQQMNLNMALGYQEPRDLDADNWLVRRPLRTASVKISKDYEKSGFGLEIVHNGDRRDAVGSGVYGTINSYTYLNGTAEYRRNEFLTFFARGQNLTNQRYETSYTFFDEGINLSVGAETIF